MICAICKHGHTAPGLATVTFTRDETIVVIRSVPADICPNCGEYFLDELTTSTVLKVAEDSVRRGSEIEVIRFAA